MARSPNPGRIAVFVLVVVFAAADEAQAEEAPLDWPVELSPSERLDLGRIGFRYDDANRSIASSLAERGFSSAEIAAAHLWVDALGLPAHRVEVAAGGIALGLDEDELAGLLLSGGSVTDWVNEHRIGGHALLTMGWSFFGVGVGWVSAGTWLLVDYQIMVSECDLDANPDCGGWEGLVYLVYGSILITGALMMAAGLPMLIIGHRRVGRWLPRGSLDEASAEELRRRRPADSGVEVSLAPTFGPNGGGLGLAMTF